MKITVIRTIHPVGASSFITEQFYLENAFTLHTIMYDCGMGNTNYTPQTLKKIIDSWVDETNVRKIDALFISHFDNDHINGISYLIERGLLGKNTLVFIPMVGPMFKEMLKSLFEQDVDKLIIKLKGAGCLIIEVKPFNPNKSQMEKNQIENKPDYVYKSLYEGETKSIKSLYEGETKSIKSFTHIIFPTDDDYWEYIPFYIQSDTIVSDIRNRIISLYPHFDIFQYENWTTIQKRRFKMCYKHGKLYSGGPTLMNMNAMLLISQNTYQGQNVQSQIYYHNEIPAFPCTFPNSYNLNRTTSCLYTSDAGLSNSQFFDVVKHAVNLHMHGNLSLFQIPHHGSRTCYTPDIFRLQPKMCFINGVTTTSNSKKTVIDGRIYHDAALLSPSTYIATIDTVMRLRQLILLDV